MLYRKILFKVWEPIFTRTSLNKLQAYPTHIGIQALIEINL